MPALVIKLEAALGANLTADPATWVWTDITAYWLRATDITVQRGGRDEFSTFQPSRLGFVLNNSDGRFTSTNPVGAWFGRWGLDTPVRVSVNPGSGYVVRATCFVAEMAHVWPTMKESFAAVSIVAEGVLRRLQQGKPLRSYLYRTLTPAQGIRPVEYWPMEDAAGATRLGSALAGGIPVTPQGLTAVLPGTGSFPGSDPLPTWPATTYFTATVRPYTSPSPNAWCVVMAVNFPNAAAGTVRFMDVWSSGTVIDWRFTLQTGAPDTMLIQGYNSAGTEVLGAGAVNFTNAAGVEAYNRPLFFRFIAEQTGADIFWSFTFLNPNADDQIPNSGTLAAATLGNVRTITYGAGSLISDAIIGHLGVGANVNYAALVHVGEAGAGDMAYDRWFDLAAAAGVTADATFPADVVQVGPEQTGDALTLFGHIIDADQGLGFEKADSRLRYVFRAQLYNLPVAMTLDYDAQQLATPWLPTDDDQLVRNDWTLSRYGGGTARYLHPTVNPASAAYDPAVRVHDDQKTVNLYSDDELPYHAQWRVHLGQDATLRYPQVSIDLTRQTGLVASWLACDVGSRIQITHPPQQLPPDTIDLLVVGWTETFSLHGLHWRADLNCISARPDEVMVVENTRLGRLDAVGSSLLDAATAGATTLRVWTDITRSPVWSTTTGFSIDVAGEQVTPTAVTSPAISFVAAGTAAHAVNASVTPGLPAGIAAGDALFVFAAIRNAGAGSPNTPTGYTSLFAADNIALFGKIAASGEVAPTVTFTGGVANADTSAQMAAFRACSLHVCNTATQANAAAQNIAYPAMGADRFKALFLTLGWKQDDWTSVATLAGMTEIGEPSTTTGDDQGIVWDYLIKGTTGNQEIASGSFVVTGGVNAVSRGAVVAIAGDVQSMTVTRAANGVSKAQAVGETVNVWRTGFVAL